jgi:two-component system response regulator AtoC
MATNAQTPQLRVVVIDDDPTVLVAAVAVLDALGLASATFSDPIEALASIRESGADIVVSDIYMPNCDGFDVLKKAKQSAPECDVVLVTARGDIETAVRALRKGATDFVQKPLTAASLRAALERTQRFHSLSLEKRDLETQVQALESEIQELTRSNSTLIGDSDAMQALRAEVARVAEVDVTVLITGESGTGKELAARALHAASARKDAPFVPVNCASIPADLFESEMFGHRRGAFTGAVDKAKGFVNAAERGTLFLDEIGDLPSGSQAKILRLLEQKTYTSVGDPTERNANLRIVAATNQNLEALVQKNQFRGDLYYRLAVCHIEMPALRDHKSDIPILALYFALQAATTMGRMVEKLSCETVQSLMAYHFPGNVRELRNIIERSVIFADHTSELRPEHLPSLEGPAISPSPTPPPTGSDSTLNMETVERGLYTEALSRTGNNISAAARLLGISRGKLRHRLSALGMQDDEE